jgi:hypothetical protein
LKREGLRLVLVLAFFNDEPHDNDGWLADRTDCLWMNLHLAYFQQGRGYSFADLLILFDESQREIPELADLTSLVGLMSKASSPS